MMMDSRQPLIEWIKAKALEAAREAWQPGDGPFEDRVALAILDLVDNDSPQMRMRAQRYSPQERRAVLEECALLSRKLSERGFPPADVGPPRKPEVYSLPLVRRHLVAAAQGVTEAADEANAGTAKAQDQRNDAKVLQSHSPPSRSDLAAFIDSGMCPSATLREVAERIAKLYGHKVHKVQVTGWALGGLVGWVNGVEAHWPAAELRADAKRLSTKRRRLRNPMAPLVRAFRSRPHETSLDSRPYGIIPNAAYRTPKQIELPSMPERVLAAATIEHEDAYLPGLEPQPGPEPAWPLTLFDVAGKVSMVDGRGGIALPFRLALEAMMQAPPSKRNSAYVMVTIRDIAEWLWPHGWKPSGELRKKLAQAAEVVNRLAMPWEFVFNGRTFRNWRPVAVRADAYDSLDAAVLLQVQLPVGSGQGPLVDRARLRAYGPHSRAYRGYLSVVSHWNEHGTRNGRRILPVRPRVKRNAEDLIVDAAGNVIREPGGKPTRNAKHRRAVQLGGVEDNPWAERYGLLRVFTPDGLAGLVYGKASLDSLARGNYRQYRRRAVKTFEGMAEDGALMLPEGRTPEGAAGWQVLPPEGFGMDG